MSNAFPVVYVTLADQFGNPAEPFLSVECGPRTVHGNTHVLDQFGYRLRVAPGCILPVVENDGTPVLGTASVEAGRLVVTPR